MIGISISARREWEYTLKYFNICDEELNDYPFGRYFYKTLKGRQLVFYYTGVRKVNSAAANQYMIIKFALDKIIVVGTCAGIDRKYKALDIIIPNVAYQYDCTVKEIEPLIKERYSVKLDLSELNFEYNTGSIGTADKAVVIHKDYLDLKNNDITVADTEAAGIAQVCTMNKVKCIIVKGISDFPREASHGAETSSNDEQYNDFVDNVPKIMKIVFDEYLEKVI